MLLTVGFGALIKWLTDKYVFLGPALIGGLVSAVLFSLGRHLFGFYLTHADAAGSFAAAASLAMLMLCLFFSAAVFLFGAEVTAATAPAKPFSNGRQISPQTGLPEPTPCKSRLCPASTPLRLHTWEVRCGLSWQREQLMTLVLLVEDEVNLLRALETLVIDDGYRVHTAADGQYAMLEVARERPDIIVSDVMMPRMDGPDLVRALLAIPALSGIPVVMTSATALDPAIPVHTFLSNPFSAVCLLEVLRSVQEPRYGRVGMNLTLNLGGRIKYTNAQPLTGCNFGRFPPS